MSRIDIARELHQEEKPLLEFPQLVFGMIMLCAFLEGLSFLILPWYLPVALFCIIAVMVSIFVNPFTGVIVFISGAFLHPTQYLQSLQSLHVARSLAVLVLLALGAHMLVYKDITIRKSWQHLFIVLLGGSYFMSSLKFPDYSLQFFYEFIPKILLVYFLMNILVKTRKQCLILFWTLVVLAFTVSVVAIYQHLTGIGFYYKIEGITRVSGTDVDPNFFAVQLVMLVPIVLNFFLVEKKILLRGFLGGICILLLAAIIFTYSRTGMLILGFALALFIIRPVFQKKKNWLPLTTAVICLIFMIPFVPQKYWERLNSITDLKDPAIIARFDTWRIGMEIIAEHPFVGIGYGAFKYEYGQRAASSPYVETKMLLQAHNSYIELAAESGLFALGIFLIILTRTVKALRRAQYNFSRQKDERMVFLTQAMENSFYIFLLGAFFLSIMHLLILWIVIALASVLDNVSGEPGEA